LLFRSLLEELVSKVDGAEGAIFLEKDGEAVAWYAEGDPERLRLRAAYSAVVLEAARALAREMKVGATRRLVLGYNDAKFIIEELESGYFLVLELNASASIGKATYLIKPTVERLCQETAVEPAPSSGPTDDR
jgi:predicted regulator of Ras-like GTPase activity (Roadblock/LC7/MglB family)